MHIISKKALVEFWLTDKEAEKTLRAWYLICKKTKFDNFGQLKQAFRSVDKVGKFTVFDIGGNKWRLVTIINFGNGKVYIRRVLTHKQYDREFKKE
jgi:mRNA interferase HigB